MRPFGVRSGSFGHSTVALGAHSQGIDAFGDRIVPGVAAAATGEVAETIVVPAELSTVQTLGNTMLDATDVQVASEIR